MLLSNSIGPEPMWRYRLVRLAQCFNWGDHEYLRREWRWRFPWVFWLTVYEPRYLRGWSRFFPWRLRTAWAGVVTDLLVRRCPGCRERFTYGELTGKTGQLSRYMSGTTWHERCQTEAPDDAN